MAEYVDSTVKEIDSRLAALQDEVSRLRAARAALIGGRQANSTSERGARTAASARKATAKPSTNSGRRSRGTRADQALTLVRARPGIKIPQIAKELGIEPNYLYRVMPKLVGSGQVTRQGQGWHPAS